MTHRLVNNAATIMSYDAENRLVQVSGATAATFVYNGDGERVKSTINGATTAFIGNIFEWTGSTTSMKRYYYAGATRVAMRTGSTLNYILGDHLGSSNITTDANGVQTSETMYKPWGEVRYSSGTLPTKYTFTGQYSNVSDFGLMYYNARWVDPVLGRFTQADTIIPQPGNPLAWDRYAYGYNNPSRFTDPSGHSVCDMGEYADPECNDPNVHYWATVNERINNNQESNSGMLFMGSVPTDPLLPDGPPDFDGIDPKNGVPIPPHVPGLPDDEWEYKDPWPDGSGRGYKNKSDPDGTVYRPDFGYGDGNKGDLEGEQPHWNIKKPGSKPVDFPGNVRWGRPGQPRNPGIFNRKTGAYETALIINVSSG